MAEQFFYRDPFPLEKDSTEYRLLTRDHVETSSFRDRECVSDRT